MGTKNGTDCTKKWVQVLQRSLFAIYPKIKILSEDIDYFNNKIQTGNTSDGYN